MSKRIDQDRPRRSSDYTYDYDRADYQAAWYEANRQAHIERAKLRYRNNRDALRKAAREKYKPKTQRHSIYRQ